MLSDKDRAVVYSMCRTGMELSVLKMSFPQFDFEDIKKIYEEYKSEGQSDAEEITISCNCS